MLRQSIPRGENVNIKAWKTLVEDENGEKGVGKVVTEAKEMASFFLPKPLNIKHDERKNSLT